MNERILVVDDEPAEGERLGELLVHLGYAALTVADADAALAAVGRGDIDAVVTDVRLAGMSGIQLCKRMKNAYPDIPVIVATGHADVDTAVAALRAGAFDFMVNPLDPDAVASSVGRAIEQRGLTNDLRALRRVVATHHIDGLIGDSPAIRQIGEIVARIAHGDAAVLITGESGTGKDLVARAIHRIGPRTAMPFVAINCAAVPAELLESELFGHVKGAFTDARRARPGLFQEAGGGTVFLDEIGEMTLEMQVKLLRVLQERRVRPVGSDEDASFAARVVCATNRDLEAEVGAGRFRQDLFYRVNVVTIEVPPLRARPGDALLLANHLLERIAARAGKTMTSFTPGAVAKLLDYHWPGNVRELENCVERAVALTQGTEIHAEDLPVKVREHQSARIEIESNDATRLITLAEIEDRYVRKVLGTFGGNKTRAARALGIDRRSLYRRLDVDGD